MEFNNSGVSDKYENLFYFRYTKEGTNKFRVNNESLPKEVKASLRLVIQLNGFNQLDLINSIMTDISEFSCEISDSIEINFYSDDTFGIYEAEYGEKLTKDNITLVSIDFTTTINFYNNYCELVCLTC